MKAFKEVNAKVRLKLLLYRCVFKCRLLLTFIEVTKLSVKLIRLAFVHIVFSKFLRVEILSLQFLSQKILREYFCLQFLQLQKDYWAPKCFFQWHNICVCFMFVSHLEMNASLLQAQSVSWLVTQPKMCFSVFGWHRRDNLLNVLWVTKLVMKIYLVSAKVNNLVKQQLTSHCTIIFKGACIAWLTKALNN